MKRIKQTIAFLLALVLTLGIIPALSVSNAADSSQIKERINGDRFNGYTISIRPAGSTSALCIKNNGHGSGHDPVHIFAHGDSFRFYRTKADSECYYIRYFDGADQYDLSSKYVDLDDGGKYMNEGNAV